MTSIYTHWDGQPAHHGPILKRHYADEEAVRGLLALGDLSVLAPEPGEQQDFDSPDHPCWCLAYGRDRGEKDVQPSRHPSERWPDSGQEYEYLFRDELWYVRAAKHTDSQEWRPL